MLEFINDESEVKVGKKIDLRRLKGEIKALSGELRFLKSRIRDPKLNIAAYGSEENKEFYNALFRRNKPLLRFNKLVTLRALMRGKIHFHKNTGFEVVAYALYKLGRFPTKEDLWEWVEDVRKEFEIK
jgi:hypothetical protein